MKCTACALGGCEHEGRCTMMIREDTQDYDGNTYWQRCVCE